MCQRSCQRSWGRNVASIITVCTGGFLARSFIINKSLLSQYEIGGSFLLLIENILGIVV